MHSTAAFVLHGEQAIPILLGWLLALLVVLATLAYLLVRLARHRLRKGSLLLSPLPFVFFAIGVWIWIRSQAPNSGPPKMLSGAAVRELTRHLPEYAPFSLTGAAYFNNRLYVGSNVGLLEIENGAVVKLFQMHRSDSVVSGPWFDRADHLLWVMDDHAHELLNFNGSSWQRISMPQPPKGYYSRGDVLKGIKPVGTDAGFWVTAAGAAWRWNVRTGSWIAEPEPQLNNDDTILGVLPIQGEMAYIVRHELLSFLIKSGQQFKSDTVTVVSGSEPHKLNVRGGISFLSEMWTVARASGYICDKDGRMLVASSTGVISMQTPGPCEALAVGQDGDLVASFRGRGIFRLAGGEWRLLSAPVPGSGEGNYWAFLTIGDDETAYVTDAKPVLDEQNSHGTDMHWKRNADTIAWIIRGGRAAKVKLD